MQGFYTALYSVFCTLYFIPPTASAEPTALFAVRRRMKRRTEKREPKSLPNALVESWRRRRRCGELRASTVQRYLRHASVSGGSTKLLVLYINVLYVRQSVCASVCCFVADTFVVAGFPLKCSFVAVWRTFDEIFRVSLFFH